MRLGELDREDRVLGAVYVDVGVEAPVHEAIEVAVLVVEVLVGDQLLAQLPRLGRGHSHLALGLLLGLRVALLR